MLATLEIVVFVLMFVVSPFLLALHVMRARNQRLPTHPGVSPDSASGSDGVSPFLPTGDSSLPGHHQPGHSAPDLSPGLHDPGQGGHGTHSCGGGNHSCGGHGGH